MLFTQNPPVPWTVTEQVQSWLELMMILQILSRKKEKNISWKVAKTMAEHEMSFMNFEPEFPETVAQHVILNFNVIHIKREYQSAI